MSGDTLPIAIDLLVEAGDWADEDALASLVARAVEASFAVGRLPVMKGSELSVVFTDDAHVRQLNAGLADTLSEANTYTDSRISGLRKTLGSRADGGTAAALAAGGIPQAFSTGKIMLGVGFGDWRSASGVAIGGSALLDDGRTAVKAGATFDTNGGSGFSAGIGYQF